MTYINNFIKPLTKSSKHPFLTQKYIRECPYIGTKILNSFRYFKAKAMQDTLPNHPMIGYFKHNIKRKPFKSVQLFTKIYTKLDRSFTLETFINVGKQL